MHESHYKILGILITSSFDEVINAYRKLAQKYHPDKNKDKNATSKFIEIKESYEFIIKHFDVNVTHTNYEYSATTLVFNIKVSFYESFINSKYYLTDHKIWIMIPPVIHNQSFTINININTISGTRKATIFVTLYDPNAFYKLYEIKGKIYLSCDINVSVAKLLSLGKISLKNINPVLTNIEYCLNLKDKTDQIEIDHAGLRTINGIRDKLIVNIKIDYINLQNEHYYILLKLKEELDKTLSNFKTSIENKRNLC